MASRLTTQVRRRTLVGGLLGGALTPASDGPRASRDPLLAALDLTQAGLVKVRAALEDGDAGAARAALARYYRDRPAPRWYPEDPHPNRKPAASDRVVADRALRHELESVGVWHAFGPKIDWSYNLTAQSDSPATYTPEWTWQLNRHYAWAAMAREYAATGDPRYGRELARQITDWTRDNPVPVGRRDDSPGSRWRPMEAGIRMYDTWQQVFRLAACRAEAFTDDALLAMVGCMVDHARYLSAFRGTANRECMMANGLLHIGALLPEMRESARWRAGALLRLRRELDRQVYPDGAQYELTPAYHALSLSMFVSALRLARAGGYRLPAGYEGRLERMYDLFARLMQPDRTTPPFNDSSEVDVPGMLRQGLTLFPGRLDWQYLASGGDRGTAPAYTSCLYPYGGWCVMRSGWGPDALYLAMDAGPFGFSHYHEDKLSFVLHAHGSRLVFEAGSYLYDASAMRQYARSSLGHNVVHVDGLGQARELMPPDHRVARRPMAIVWRSSVQYDYASASYGRLPDEVWGTGKRRGVVHTRQVLLVKPAYWIVVDTLRPPDGAAHQYESTFHLDAPDATVDEHTRSVTIRSESGAGLAILPLSNDGLRARIVAGQEAPVLQGWLPRGQGRTGADARPTASYLLAGQGTVRLLYVLAPARAAEPFPVSAVEHDDAHAGALSARIVRRDGTVDRIAIVRDGALEFWPASGTPARFRAG